jgi:hypothetical protein
MELPIIAPLASDFFDVALDLTDKLIGNNRSSFLQWSGLAHNGPWQERQDLPVCRPRRNEDKSDVEKSPDR